MKPRRRKAPAPLERVVHAQIAAWLKVVLPLKWRRTTVPSGGGGRIRGAQLKRMGLEAGLPDILLLHADGAWLGLEVKRPGAGYTSEAQDAWIAWAAGRIGVVRSIEDAQAFLRWHGVLK